MYRAIPAANAIVDAMDRHDAYRKHISAMANAKSVIDTSTPPINRRLEQWRIRFARDHEMRQALEQASGNETPQKSPKGKTPKRSEDPTPLLQLRVNSKIVHPTNGVRSKGNGTKGRERIHFGPKGEPEFAAIQSKAEGLPDENLPDIPKLVLEPPMVVAEKVVESPADCSEGWREGDEGTTRTEEDGTREEAGETPRAETEGDAASSEELHEAESVPRDDEQSPREASGASEEASEAGTEANAGKVGVAEEEEGDKDEQECEDGNASPGCEETDSGRDESAEPANADEGDRQIEMFQRLSQVIRDYAKSASPGIPEDEEPWPELE
jgi:hypothetical protein